MNVSDLIDEMFSSNLSQVFYADIGSTWILDSINIYLVSSIGFIGCVLNLLCFVIFSKIQSSHVNLYFYFKAKSVISSMQCLIIMFKFISFSPRYMHMIAVSTFASIYRCTITSYIYTSLVFIINVFDIFILLEKLSDFDHFFKRFTQFRPLIVVLISICLCLLINSPFLFYSPSQTKD